MSGSRKPMQPFKCLAQTLGLSLREFAERFVDLFAPPPNTALAFSVASNIVALDDVSEEGAFDAPFTAQDFEAALGTLRRKSATGIPGVTHQALKNLSDVANTWMLAWLSTIWSTCDFPASWKTAWVVPIFKTGKPSSLLGAYRPVSLLLSVAKLFERLVHVRLRWFLEASGLPSLEQIGFRAHLALTGTDWLPRSPYRPSSVLDLTSAIEHNRAIGNYTLASFVDVEKAYDWGRASISVSSLRAIGLRGRIMRLFAAYLGERTIAVQLRVTISSTRLLFIGLPQGSLLSSTLFNVVMSRVAPSIQRDPLVSATIFA